MPGSMTNLLNLLDGHNPKSEYFGWVNNFVLNSKIKLVLISSISYFLLSHSTFAKSSSTLNLNQISSDTTASFLICSPANFSDSWYGSN